MDAVLFAGVIALSVAFLNGVFSIIRWWLGRKKDVDLGGFMKKFGVIIVVITILLSLLGGYAVFAGFPSSVNIDYPTDDQRVDIVETVRGKSENIPKDEVIWIVVYVEKISRYYPMLAPAIMQRTGEWISTTTLGGAEDINDKFIIIAVLADQTAQAGFNTYNTISKNNEYYPGMETLPAGATIVDSVTVVRK